LSKSFKIRRLFNKLFKVFSIEQTVCKNKALLKIKDSVLVTDKNAFCYLVAPSEDSTQFPIMYRQYRAGELVGAKEFVSDLNKKIKNINHLLAVKKYPEFSVYKVQGSFLFYSCPDIGLRILINDNSSEIFYEKILVEGAYFGTGRLYVYPTEDEKQTIALCLCRNRKIIKPIKKILSDLGKDIENYTLVNLDTMLTYNHTGSAFEEVTYEEQDWLDVDMLSKVDAFRKNKNNKILNKSVGEIPREAVEYSLEDITNREVY